MDLLNKLLMMRQLRFEEGRISLLGQRVFLGPRDTLIGLTNFLLKHPDTVPEVYEHIRLSFDKGWADTVKQTYGLKSKDYFRWLIDISNIAGWGKSELIKFRDETFSGIFRTSSGLIAETFKGKANSPVCHIWRGLTAGGLTSVFDRDIDWAEDKCLAQGDPYCEFIFEPRELMKKEKNELFIKQLPIYQ